MLLVSALILKIDTGAIILLSSSPSVMIKKKREKIREIDPLYYYYE